MYAKQIMYTPKFVVKPNDKLHIVVEKWKNKPCDVPVVDNEGVVVGLITAKQIIRKILPQYLLNGNIDNVMGFSDLPNFSEKICECFKKEVKDVMKSDYNWAYEDESTLSIALKLINDKKCVRTIVVIDRNKKLKGLIDVWSVVKRMLKEGNCTFEW
ncbi:CBS domain-containing protein [Deferribacter autotrophicus]|uniref:CBS domain-containing protein n=1 Tax=Deferribacter autotrophicus TaxID=500465 RepID=A0A5A8F8S5_9BACT|nr:CBS domain-containing protein [Deferribacter autotrophicus]KAA0258942.1 CBS domain-containing protein [Deferribacter autotrophicus]